MLGLQDMIAIPGYLLASSDAKRMLAALEAQYNVH